MSLIGPSDPNELPTLRRYNAGKVSDTHYLLCKFPLDENSIDKVRPCLPKLMRAFSILSPHVKYVKFFYFFDAKDQVSIYKNLLSEDEYLKNNDIHERQKSRALERMQVKCTYIAERGHKDEAWKMIQILKNIIELHFTYCTFVLKHDPMVLALPLRAIEPSQKDAEAIAALRRFIKKFKDV